MISKLLPVGWCLPASQPCSVPGSTPSLTAIIRCDRPSALRAAARRTGNEAVECSGLYPRNWMMAGR